MLPNKITCDKIIKHNESFVGKTNILDGYKVTQYSYRLANYSDFLRPLTSVKQDAFELRGITFVQNNPKNPFSYDRFLMIGKFFNLNQTDGWMYKDVKNKKIAYVQEKLDGSLIRFIKLPNGKVVAKTIYAFESEQAEMAIKIYNSNANIKEFVDFTLENNLAAMFEFVSPNNQVVLKYFKDELRLLVIRDEHTGKYYGKAQLISLANRFNIPYAEYCDNLTLEEYMEKTLTEEGKEGWVITFEDGQKVKLKTKWYLSLHRIMTSVSARDNDIINSILEESMDDLISQIPENETEMRNRLTEISNKVIDYINMNTNIIYNKNLEYDGDKKSFAIANKQEPFFHIMMKTYEFNSKDNIRKLLIEYVKKMTKNLSDAKEFLERI